MFIRVLDVYLELRRGRQKEVKSSIPPEGKLFNNLESLKRDRRNRNDMEDWIMGIRNSANWWQKFKHFHPEIGLVLEILGVLLMMLVCCIEI